MSMGTIVKWHGSSGIAASLLVVLALAAGPAGGERADTRYEARRDTVQALIGALGRLSPEGEDAEAARRAGQLLAESDQLRSAGEVDAATRRLQEAYVTARLALKRVGDARGTFDPEPDAAGTIAGVTEKERRDFENLRASVDALLTAIERIAAEKGQQESAAPLAATVRAHSERAREAMDAGRAGEARALMEEAYSLARRGVAGLRGGETLVRTLHFDSPEAEYAYELDRNDTHRMLLRVLSQEQPLDPEVQKGVQTHVARADTLRDRSRRLASAGHYREAIAALEESTRALVQAIRSAGIFIPG